MTEKPRERLKPKPGDLIGFSGEALTSVLINLGSYGIPFWDLSHIGIMGEYRGKLLLFESNVVDPEPCEITGKFFAGTQAHTLESRLKDYSGKVWHYPLKSPLYDFEVKRLNNFLADTVGIPYDQIGAFRSGGFGWSLFESFLHEEDLSHVFCSEWCAAAHAQIGRFNTDNFSRWSPNRLARTMRRQGILAKPRRLK